MDLFLNYYGVIFTLSTKGPFHLDAAGDTFVNNRTTSTVLSGRMGYTKYLHLLFVSNLNGLVTQGVLSKFF